MEAPGLAVKAKPVAGHASTAVFGRSDAEGARTLTSAANHGNGLHPLQPLFNLGTTLKKHLVNPLPQIHECFNGHP
jgi:hypothetical protein